MHYRNIHTEAVRDVVSSLSSRRSRPSHRLPEFMEERDNRAPDPRTAPLRAFNQEYAIRPDLWPKAGEGPTSTSLPPGEESAYTAPPGEEGPVYSIPPLG